MGRTYEFRCPIHGFIQVDEWEREIIEHPVFQRLRRIRQLGWTDYVYPGAMHTRFEHSLGVMHVATRLFDAIKRRERSRLKDEFGFSDDELKRHRRLLRFGALLHDVGHGPFSHVAEDVMPKDKTGKTIKHEAYSVEVVRNLLREVIEGSQHRDHEITTDEVANFLAEGTAAGKEAFWRDLLVGQMDADRMDYLLRDSYHCGVAYGRYDLDRIVNTVTVVPKEDGRSPRIGIRDGGIHAAESLILARYYMFTQVYFHKTRVAYDHIVGKMLADVVDGAFPGLHDLEGYLKWDDWRVLGLITAGHAGNYGKRLKDRGHFRQVWHSPEVMAVSDEGRLGKVRTALGSTIAHEAESRASWYKLEGSDIRVLMEQSGEVCGLSEVSTPVAAIKPLKQVRVYVDEADRDVAVAMLNESHLL